MDLFTPNTNGPANLLPYDGEALYYGPVMPAHTAAHYMQQLQNTIAWKNDEAVIFGRHIVTSRKVAWYGNSNYAYTYSKTTKLALPWTPELITLKQLVETLSGVTFNSCLLNLYHDGNEGMGWHSDDERSLGKDTAIASLSFGAERKFTFKHKATQQGISLLLQNGSLLLMQGTTQTHWLHALPKSKRIAQPRINLTFRTMLAG